MTTLLMAAAVGFCARRALEVVNARPHGHRAAHKLRSGNRESVAIGQGADLLKALYRRILIPSTARSALS